MSLRRSLSPSIRAVHPALFAVGFAIVTVQTVLYLGFALLESLLAPVYGTILSLLVPFVAFVFTAPLALGLYVPVRERTESVGESLRAAVRGVRRYYLEVLAATVTAFAAAVGIAMTATAVSFVLATAVQYARYAAADPGPPNVWLATWSFPLLFVCFLAVGLLVTRFADVFAAFGDAPPRSAWRSSLAFVRREPVSFLGYAAVVTVLLGTGQILPFAFDSIDSLPGVAAAIGLTVLLSSVGLVLASALHVTYFDRAVGPAVRSGPHRSPSWSRVAVAAVVLFATVAGAGYVRAADLGAGQSEIQDLPEDPHAAYQVAVNNTATSNHRYVLEQRNESAPDATFRTIERTGVDYDDRQIYIYIHGEDIVLGSYYGEGTMAIRNGSGRASATFPGLARESGDWTVLAVPGYGLRASSHERGIQFVDAEWSIESRNASTIVYRVEDEEQIRDAIRNSYAGSSGALANDSYLEVYVDREEGVVSGARFRLHSRETGNDFTYVARYEEVGTADLERPAAIGPRNSLEWFWDATYY